MEINVDQLEFIPVLPQRTKMAQYLQNDFVESAFIAYEQFYPKVGYHPPWIGYFVVSDRIVVGLCGYKGPPVNNQVEIAYGTVPEFEGRGVSSQSCKYLTALALAQKPTLRVTARTLMTESASTSILRKNGYAYVGVVDDPEDGEVWEWEYKKGDPDSYRERLLRQAQDK